MTDKSINRPTVAVAILAAGHGKRMRSSTPKHVHPVGGVPIVKRIVKASQAINPDHIAVVVSPKMADMDERLDMAGEFQVVIQEEATGTGHAVLAAIDALPPVDYVVSLLGDTPLLTGELIGNLLDSAVQSGGLVQVLTCDVENAAEYGRIERDAKDRIQCIREKKTDDPEKRVGVTEINSGIMVVQREWAQEKLRTLPMDPIAGEYLLTDLVSLAAAEGRDGEPWPVNAVKESLDLTIGINTRDDLAVADRFVWEKERKRLLSEGVTLVGQDTIFVEESVHVGKDTIILPGSMITGDTSIGERCEIGPNAIISNSTIGNDVTIRSSTIEDSEMHDLSDAGPYAHIRHGSVIGTGVHIGNFAELKNTVMEPGSKSGHVSYLGDARVGKRTNIGAGSITANYDGKKKNRTSLGDDVFVGCDTVFIAPVTVEDHARTGAGSIVTKDVEAGVTVVGVPARPVSRKDTENKG